MFWIYDLPHPWLAALFCLAFLAFTWTGLWATRGAARRWLGDPPAHNELVSYFLSAYGVFYGLMLGLIAVATYQSFSEVTTNVTREAANLRNLYRAASAYPAPLRDELMATLRSYCAFVIETEWPAQQRGLLAPGGTPLMTAFQEKLLSFNPQTPGQEALHAQALAQFFSLNEMRRLRLHRVAVGLPAALWLVVVAGAALNIALLWLFVVERLSVLLALTGFLALLIALTIFLIAALDHPFRGAFCESPEAFELVRQSMAP